MTIALPSRWGWPTPALLPVLGYQAKITSLVNARGVLAAEASGIGSGRPRKRNETIVVTVRKQAPEIAVRQVAFTATAGKARSRTHVYIDPLDRGASSRASRLVVAAAQTRPAGEVSPLRWIISAPHFAEGSVAYDVVWNGERVGAAQVDVQRRSGGRTSARLLTSGVVRGRLIVQEGEPALVSVELAIPRRSAASHE